MYKNNKSKNTNKSNKILESDIDIINKLFYYIDLPQILILFYLIYFLKIYYLLV